MPTYLMLTTLTPQGVQTLKANPSRLREVNRDVEELGAKVLHQWATLGEYDFVNIVEAADAATVAKISLALGARGSASCSRSSSSTSTRSWEFSTASGRAAAAGGSGARPSTSSPPSALAAAASGRVLEPACGLVFGIDADSALALAPLQGAAARDRPLVAHRNPGWAEAGGSGL